jgi:selenocysteine lyase/cysteine desulfurase
VEPQRPATDREDPDDPLGVRRDFPVVHNGLYLNAAHVAPVPVAVADAGRVFAERKASKPIPLDEMLTTTDEVRRQFARLVGAEADEIGFLFATSEGENIVASALDLKPGDNVVVDELHYNTTFVLYRHLEETRGIALRIVKHRDGRVAGDDFARAIDDRTRLVSVAWVSHQNGFRHDMRPLADLAHAHGALFYADAVQALGMFPVDVRAAGVDCMTSGTYKWLLGGFGVAPFFIRRELVEKIRVDRFGDLHVEKELGDHRYEIYRTAKKFEYATLPFAEVYQLGAALTYLGRVGVDRIERHTVALARDLRGRLATIHCRSPSLNIRFSDASSRWTVAGPAFPSSRNVLFRSTDVVVMSIAVVPPNTASSRGSHVVFKSPRLFAPRVRVVSDDQRAQIVVHDVSR